MQPVAAHFDHCYGIDIGKYEEWLSISNANFVVHDVDTAPLPFKSAKFDLVRYIIVLDTSSKYST